MKEIEYCRDGDLLWNRYLQARYDEHIHDSQPHNQTRVKSPMENMADGFLGLALFKATWDSNLLLLASDFSI